MSRTTHHTRIYRTDPTNSLYRNWYNNEPKWWRTLYKHKKRRAEWRLAYSKVLKGADLDNMVYPLDTRPWIYYW